ncbi:MAG: RpiB/LacA/LacB family sugar-phosphate isomerase [Eubacteriales bacterium]
MKLAIGSDQAGFALKEDVKRYLLSKGHEVQDVGMTDPAVPKPYYESAHNVATLVQKGDAERGILICGTGAGMCIHANKHQGIIAVVSESVYSTRLCRIINDANVLTFGYRIVPPEMAYEMCDAFINTAFNEGMPEDRATHLKNQKERYQTVEAGMFQK